MNISIPYSWLKEYLITSASPEKIAECLSLCGPSVEKLTKVKNDSIYEFEVTTNRVDMMSILGIAREAAPSYPNSASKQNSALQVLYLKCIKIHHFLCKSLLTQNYVPDLLP